MGSYRRAAAVSRAAALKTDCNRSKLYMCFMPKYFCIVLQESLADAKVIARRRCVYEGPLAKKSKVSRKPHPRSKHHVCYLSVINVWSSLPGTVSFVSLNAFKRSIVTVDFSNFLKCFLICVFHKGSCECFVSFSSLAVRLTASYVFM